MTNTLTRWNPLRELDDGDAAKVNAEFKDGMLKVCIAKSEAARPKQIEVKVS